jgi:hypothetical protein
MVKPIVSILIPTYNHAATLERCLRSVLEQDYEPMQVVVLDNRSTDETYDILADYEKRHRDRLYIGRLFDHVGPVDHRNRCRILANPRSMFLQYLPPTDALCPGYVSRAMGLFETSKRIGCVLTHADAIHPDGQTTAAAPFREGTEVLPGSDMMEAFMARGLHLHAMPLFRVEAYNLSHSEAFIFNRFPTWLPLVMSASIFDVGYISAPPCFCGDARARLGEAFIPAMEDQIEHYLFLQAFHTIAARLGRSAVCAHLPAAIQRLARECVRGAKGLEQQGRSLEAQALRALGLAYAPELDPETPRQATASGARA